MKVLGVAAVACALLGCASVDHANSAPLTVEQVTENHERLDGKRLRIEGWLAGCETWPFVCGLSSQADGRGRYLAFETSDELRNNLRGRRGRSVVIEATLDAFCLDHSIKRISETEVTLRWCGDAATQLNDPKLVEVR